MKFHEMNDFSESLPKLLILKFNFEIKHTAGNYSFTALEGHEFEKTLHSLIPFCSDFQEELAILDMSYVPENEMDTIIRLHETVRMFIVMHTKRKKSDKVQEEFNKLQKLELSISFGGKLPTDIMDIEQLNFLLVNNYHKTTLPMRTPLLYTFDEGVCIPCEIEPQIFTQIPLNSMTRMEFYDLKGALIGYKYFQDEHLLFITDKKLKFTDMYTNLGEGVGNYNFTMSFTLRPVYVVDAQMTDFENGVECQLRGREISFLLKKSNGARYSIGMDKNRIVSPAVGFHKLPDAFYDVKCTKDQIDLIKSRIEAERFYPNTPKVQRNVYEIAGDVLGEKFTPKKALVTTNKILSYLTLLIGVTKYLFVKKRHQLPSIKEFIKKPYAALIIDEKELKNKLFRVQK